MHTFIISVKPNFLDWERIGIGKNIGFLSISFCLYFIILFVWESRIWMKLKKWNFKKSSIKNADSTDNNGNFITFKRTCTIRNSKRYVSIESQAIGLEDEDVLEEKRKMDTTDLTQLFKDNTWVVRLVRLIMSTNLQVL